MEAIFVVGRSSNYLAPGMIVADGGKLRAVAAPRFCTSKVFTNFSGQQLRRSARNHFFSYRRNRSYVGRARAHSPGGLPPSGNPGPHSQKEILDDMSSFIIKKVGTVLAPYFPKTYDPLDWLPESLHHKLHNSEVAAMLFTREALHFGLFYFLFVKTNSVCKWFNWLYRRNLLGDVEVTEEEYQDSSFRCLKAPLQFLIVSWAVTRIVHVAAPLLRIKIRNGLIGDARAIAMVVAVSWFLSKWKQLYVAHLVATYHLDAPRIIAFDKVLSLLLYFLAASCIGEVTGFALRSLLAVGGFSGVALGLAAKEIVSNFFGGAVLFITRPFVIGERIQAGSFSGYVQDIGFLQTKILSLERVPMIVPNQNFTNEVITNYSRADNKLLDIIFPIRIQDIFLVDRIANNVVQYLKVHPDVDPVKSTPLCFLKTVHEEFLQLAVRCIVRPSGGSEFYRVQQAIVMRVVEIIVNEGAFLGSSAPFDASVPGRIDSA